MDSARTGARAPADAVVRTTGSQQVVTPAAQRAIAAVPGVALSAAVFAVTPGDPLAGNLLLRSGNAISTGLLIVNPARYAALVAATPFPAFPGHVLAHPGSGGTDATVARCPRLFKGLRGRSASTADGGPMTGST